MKGYKGMSSDMTCRGMQYEIGKTYRVDGEIALCSNGLHFCERLKDVFTFYSRENSSRYFEVYAGGQIVCDGSKSAASELTIIRELTDIEVNRCVYGNGYGYGDSYDNGYGDSYSYGYGDGYDNGYGYSYNNGNGYGYGDGYDNGYGDSYGIQRIAIYKN